MSKSKTLFTALGKILAGLWKLLLLSAYGFFKAVEVLACFFGKITEKMLN